MLVLTLIGFLFMVLLCKKQWFRKFLWGMLLLWAAAILYQTVLSRSPGPERPAFGFFFDTYRIVLHGGNPEVLRSAYMNVLLFFPMGMMVGGILGRESGRACWKALGAMLLFSACIELIQYVFALGWGECDDIMHNLLGGGLGLLIGRCAVKCRK